MKSLLIAGMALSTALLAGCNSAEKSEVRQDVQGLRQQIGNAAENARRQAVNAGLEGKVKAALETRKGLDPRHIDVEARGSAVVLKGDVGDPAQADLAERVARETEGVETVDNQLMVRVPAKSLPRPGSPQSVAPAAPDTTPSGAAPPTSTAPSPSTGY
jgi:hypothetical protein